MRVVAIDTSGGMSAIDMAANLARVNVGDHLISWHTKVEDHGIQTVQPTVENTNLKCIGGTMLECVVDFVKATYPNGCEVVVISDGHFWGNVMEAFEAPYTAELIKV